MRLLLCKKLHEDISLEEKNETPSQYTMSRLVEVVIGEYECLVWWVVERRGWRCFRSET